MEADESREPLTNGSTASTVVSPAHSGGHKKARFSVANVDSNSDSGRTDTEKIDEESEPDDKSPEHESAPGSRNRSRTNSQTVNQQTYNTLYLKSLRNYLTRDALPDERHYRNQLSIRKKFARPTLEELHEEQQENGNLLNKQVFVRIPGPGAF
jgi:hypothetical protein